jgi:uncharacterized protein YdhG (YjbR/CyaY superfamily)
MAKTNYKTIDEYHETFPAELQARMQEIRELVHKVAPEAEEVISYQIPAFKLGNKFHLIYYCAFPKHLTISSPWSAAMLNEFAAELKGMKVSKSAIQFPHDKPLPVKLIKDILEFRKTEHEAKK